MAKSSGGGKNYWSAAAGRDQELFEPGPGKTVAETRGGGSTGGTHRSAISGKFRQAEHRRAASRHDDQG